MENKTIDIEPRAAVEMQTWENIYDRVPSQYRQYVSYPITTMQECPSKAEINDKLTHACTTDSNELADYSSITLKFSERDELTSDSLSENWLCNEQEQRYIQLRYGTTILLNQFAIGKNIEDYTGSYIAKVTGQTQFFEVLRLDGGILCVRPLSNNSTNMMRRATIAVTAMGNTTYIYLTQYADPQINVKVSEIDNDSKTFGMNLAADLLGTMLQDTKVNNSKEYK